MAPPSLLSSFGLWWSRTVHPVLGGRPNPHLLSTRLRGSERAGGSSVWERRGRMEAGKRGRGWSTSPAPSRFSQSPEPVLVEVSTEDGADISSEPMTKENQITWHWMFSPAWPLKEQLNMKLGHLLSFWERDDSIDWTSPLCLWGSYFTLRNKANEPISPKIINHLQKHLKAASNQTLKIPFGCCMQDR